MSKEVAKFLAHVLRHEPDQLGLKLDNDGWVSWTQLSEGFHSYHDQNLDPDDLKDLVMEHNSGRFGIREEAVCALEGHSTTQFDYAFQEPPDSLFYAASGESVDEITRTSLKSQSPTKRYVKLHEDPECALDARPQLKDPTLVRISAMEGWDNGTIFYKRFGEEVEDWNNDWYAKDVPGDYLNKEE